jgi:hypothetical protein
MAWQYHAPSGAYRNHALSKKIRDEAEPFLQAFRFLRPEPGFGKGRGESLTITRIDALPLAHRVTETDRLPSGRPVISTKQVSLSPWGFKVPVTQLEKHLTHFNIHDPFQRALRNQIARTKDVMAIDAFKQTPLKYVPTASGATITDNGTPSGTADRNLGIQDLRRIHDELVYNKADPFMNGRYVGILSVQAARGIKNDPEYKDWQAPTTRGPFISGRLERDVEGFALFETNHVDALARFAGQSTVAGEAIFFGADAAILLSTLMPELRMGVPDELGLVQDFGWVAEMEAHLVEERAALARVMHVTSG